MHVMIVTQRKKGINQCGGLRDEEACALQRGVEGRERKYEVRVPSDDEDRQCHM